MRTAPFALWMLLRRVGIFLNSSRVSSVRARFQPCRNSPYLNSLSSLRAFCANRRHAFYVCLDFPQSPPFAFSPTSAHSFLKGNRSTWSAGLALRLPKTKSKEIHHGNQNRHAVLRVPNAPAHRNTRQTAQPTLLIFPITNANASSATIPTAKPSRKCSFTGTALPASIAATCFPTAPPSTITPTPPDFSPNAAAICVTPSKT